MQRHPVPRNQMQDNTQPVQVGPGMRFVAFDLAVEGGRETCGFSGETSKVASMPLVGA